MSQAQLIPAAPPSPIFSFKSHQIRTVTEDGQTWFVARDVCAALGIGWSGTSLNGIPNDCQGMWSYHTPSKQRDKFITEPAVYKLAFRSNKPEADAFTNWVACEVLPTIRKTGKFEAKPKSTPKALPTVDTEQQEKRKRRHREDLELAIKGIGIISLDVAAQCKILMRVLNDRLECLP